MNNPENSEVKDKVKPDEVKPNISSLNVKRVSKVNYKGLRIGSLLRTWAEVSKINYFSSQPLKVINSGHGIRRKSIGVYNSKEFSFNDLYPIESLKKTDEELFAEEFPTNVTFLMNEDQLWGCFYIFPEYYADVYSPVVRIRHVENVPEIVNGILTRDMIAACLTYLKRIPILGDYVYIKLDLSSNHLICIDLLQHYKYLVYLDLSSNLLSELSVLSYLPYLQYLSVAFNRLGTVLEYETPQWFLTEVHYKFNSVKKIRDLSAFWSITILDLSHNNIKCISGLENLGFLRRLDLSFNHIQRLENLNHLMLLWLDVSYNNISSFEFGGNAGLWTLLHLEYLNLNENNFTSMKMFAGCVRLRELHARNNRLSTLLELAVYMRQLRRLIILDLRANPIYSVSGYKHVVLSTFPLLLSLDAMEVDPVEQRSSKMDMNPDVHTFATRRLLRLLYIEQLSRARVSPYVPPADTTEVPIVVLVGYEAVGKGTLARRLASECSSNIELAVQHTTATFHHTGHYIEVTRSKFDDMLLAGEYLTYCESNGESYGLSRESAFIKNGKVKIVCMDLISALMLKLRDRRPYLILVSRVNKKTLSVKQQERKAARNEATAKRMSFETPLERSTLQVLLSGRIIITGILNEILVTLPEDKEQSEFVIASECSLLMDSEARQAVRNYVRDFNMINMLTSSMTSVSDADKQDKNSQIEAMSLYSLYKESQGTHDEYASDVGQNSFQDQSHANARKSTDVSKTPSKQEKLSNMSHPKSVDFSKYTSSTWKGLSMIPIDSAKSSKSVTFTSQDNNHLDKEEQMSGLLIEAQTEKEVEKSARLTKYPRSISTKLPRYPLSYVHTGSGGSLDDMDLWIAFLVETGLLQASEAEVSQQRDGKHQKDNKSDDQSLILKELESYHRQPFETQTTSIRDDYEQIHRNCPGLFWDTVSTDDHYEAFLKVKNIIHNIVDSQKYLKPMFDIDFANLEHYPTVQKQLEDIRKQISPRRLFY